MENEKGKVSSLLADVYKQAKLLSYSFVWTAHCDSFFSVDLQKMSDYRPTDYRQRFSDPRNKKFEKFKKLKMWFNEVTSRATIIIAISIAVQSILYGMAWHYR